ncbi:Coiled-coil and C2 domain-containing protein 1B [Chytriomyces hyalinus]|nr:Coiled-coil and C2 domain-containing protein 1B [Chytriomyces hyalinus]
MSWFGSSGSVAKKEKSNADTFAFSDEFNDDLDNIGAGSDVENDAALLAELEGLKSEMGLNVKPKPKPKPKPTAPPTAAKNTFNMTPDASGHVEITLPEVESHEEEAHVEFSEADMDDPDLLRELAAVTGGSETMLAAEVTVEVHTVRTTSVPIVASAFAAATDDDDELAALRADMNMGSGPAATPRVSSNEDVLPLAQRLKCTDPATVAKYISLEKLRLSNAKTAGDSLAGSEAQRAIKALEAHYDELIAEQNVGPKSPVSNEAEAQPLASSITLIEVKRRQLEYKQAALAFKQRGDAPKARELLIVSKTMQDTIDFSDTNGFIPFEYRLPGPPPAPPAPVAVVKPTPAKPVAASAPATPAVKPPSAAAAPSATAPASKPATIPSTPVISATTTPSLPANTKELLTRLQTQLESQIALCTSIAGTYFKAGNKPAALEYHKRKKTYQNDIEVLSSVLASFDGSAAAASAIYFHYEEIRYEVEQSHADVGNEEMEVLVERAFDLTVKGVPEAELAAYIAFDIGWPVDGGDGKGQSGTIGKTSSPEFNYSKRIKIDRNRPFQRHLERKRAVFDVYHLAKGFGGISMFSKPVQIGRASVPLNTLLNQCEIHEVVDIMDVVNPRKSTGGKLEVKLRLRVPLAKRDITVKQERWVALSLGGPVTTQTTDVNQTVSAPAVAEIPQTSASPAVVVPVVPPAAGIVSAPAAAVTVPPTVDTPRPATPAAPAPAVSSGATPAPTPAAQDVDEVELEFLNPDNIASNMVLENEHGAILAQISALKVAKKPIPEDLLDRKNGYEIRMNMLVTLVQLGTLTMPAYIANVKSSIAVTKKHALLFKNHNKIELAKQAMVRIKAMTDEVAEVEQAIANGEL